MAYEQMTADMVRRVDALTAEVAELRKTEAALESLQDSYGQLLAENVRLRKDAERYRWLRRNPAWMGWTRDHQPEHVDAAVDGDMATL